MTYIKRPIKPITQKDVDRFWSKVDIREPNNCWNWTGKPAKNGHGLFNAGNTLHRPPRFAYIHANGKLDANHLQRKNKVVVTCGNTLCVNPAHLVIGDQQLVWDRIRENKTMKVGSKHKMSKITEQDVIDIRERYKPQCKENGYAPIGKDYGVSPGCIRDIIIGKTWQHVE